MIYAHIVTMAEKFKKQTLWWPINFVQVSKNIQISYICHYKLELVSRDKNSLYIYSTFIEHAKCWECTGSKTQEQWFFALRELIP